MLDRPIIFIGAPRSGTTIISEFVLQHPALAWPSNYQEKFPRHESINLVRRIFDNSAWRMVGKKRQINGISPLNRFLFTPGECYSMWSYLAGPDVNFRHGFLLGERATPERSYFMRSYLTGMVRWQGRQRFACKLTGPARLGYLASVFPDAVSVHIRRRLIPTVNSLLKVWFWGERGARKLWWSGAYSARELEWAANHVQNAVCMTAFQLRKIEQVLHREAENLNLPLLHVDYESFVQNPEAGIQEILDFCELDFHPSVRGYLLDNPVVDRNRRDDEYFSRNEIQEVNQIQLDELAFHIK